MRDRRKDRDNEWDDIRHDVRQGNLMGMRWTAGWTFLVVGLVIAVLVIWLLFLPWYSDQRNEVRTNSFQFEQTISADVDKKVGDIADMQVTITNLQASGEDREDQINAELVQIEATTNDICSQAAKVDLDDLTDSGRKFVEDNC